MGSGGGGGGGGRRGGAPARDQIDALLPVLVGFVACLTPKGASGRNA